MTIEGKFPVIPGNISPLEGYEVGSSYPKDAFQAALSVTFCESFLPPICQHLIVESIAGKVVLSAGDPDVLIVGTGTLGMVVAGLGFGTDNDGQPYSHGLVGNDYDVVILSGLSDRKFRQAFVLGSKRAVAQILSCQGIAYWSDVKTQWSGSSLWGLPPYLRVQTSHGAEDVFYETLHLHHQELAGEQAVLEFLRNYQPWYSTRLGSPMALGRPSNQGGFDYFLWNPYPIDESGRHYIRVTAPEIFGEQPRSILQSTRVALGVVQAAIAARELAEIHPEDLQLMRQAVEKHGPNLSSDQRASAERRLATIIHRAEVLERFSLGFGVGPAGLKENGALRAVVMVQKILDKIKWGEAVLGMTVSEWLEKRVSAGRKR